MSFDFYLPLLTYPDPTPRAGLVRAIDLAATLGGQVSVLTHAVDIPPVTNPLATTIVDYSAMSSDAEAHSKMTGDELARYVSNLCEKFELPVRLEVMTCGTIDLDTMLATVARTHDLTLCVIDGESHEHRTTAEAILFESGGPVIMFPATEAATHIQTVAIAWDGGKASARAMRDALPILKLAEHVIVLTVRDEKPIDESSIEALREFLGTHDIEITHYDAPLQDRSIGDAIQAAAVEHDAGLLIMGAYGHNRWREFILGGATRTVLAKMLLPTLMSH